MRGLVVAGSVAAMVVAPFLFSAASAQVAPAAGGGSGGGGTATTMPGAGMGRGRGPGGPGGPGGMVSATQPALGRGHGSRHTDFLQIARRGAETIQVVFIGDSITDGWLAAGREVWDKNIEPLKPANFGIGGDTTQGVLWRLQNGTLDGLKAKVIVLMLGTNNINRSPNAEIVEGNRMIVEEFKKRQPQAKILVLGIFPRAATAEDPYRASIKEINEKLATFADNKQVYYLDIGEKFLAPDGSMPRDVMPDMLHPNAKGYQIWWEAMGPKLLELLKG